MWVLYLALVWLAIWLARRGSFTVLLVPVVGAAAWWSVISLGETYWGWTA
jgi:hypothetical protein